MQINAFLCIVAYLVGLSCAKSYKSPHHIKNGGQQSYEMMEMEEMTTPRPKPKKDILLMDKKKAFQVIMERMLIAMGTDFVNERHRVPDNATYPTVASPLNITTLPCPDIYTKCSSEIFLSSCYPPEDTNPELWDQRLNLYFELPHDLLAKDDLLNATLRIYKNNSLPLGAMLHFIVELYQYTKSLTKVHDENILFTSKEVPNDYTGWISFDITDLIRKLDLANNYHGFLIKMKESTGVYWHDPTLFIPMNCSDGNRIVPVPFGIITDQPEQKFPSLTIYTGKLDQHFYSRTQSEEMENNRERLFGDHENMELDKHNELDQNNLFYPELEKKKDMYYPEHDKEEEHFMEEIHSSTKPHHHRRRKEKVQRNNRKMSGDDPKVHDEIYSYEDESMDLQWPFDNEKESHPIHKYNLKDYRKSVTNQVYNRPMPVEDLDIPTPSALSPMNSLPLNKESSSWLPTDAYETHQQVSRKRDHSHQRKRHHNHQGKNGTHRPHSHNHHSHKKHENSEQYNIRKLTDLSLKRGS